MGEPMDRFEVKFDAGSVDEKTGTFEGYGACFGNVDSYGDVIVKGAFKASLRDWEKAESLPPVLVQQPIRWLAHQPPVPDN